MRSSSCATFLLCGPRAAAASPRRGPDPCPCLAGAAQHPGLLAAQHHRQEAAFAAAAARSDEGVRPGASDDVAPIAVEERRGGGSSPTGEGAGGGEAEEQSPEALLLSCDEELPAEKEVQVALPGGLYGGADEGGGESAAARLYAQQELTVLEEFASCLKKIISVGQKRCEQLWILLPGSTVCEIGGPLAPAETGARLGPRLDAFSINQRSILKYVRAMCNLRRDPGPVWLYIINGKSNRAPLVLFVVRQYEETLSPMRPAYSGPPPLHYRPPPAPAGAAFPQRFPAGPAPAASRQPGGVGRYVPQYHQQPLQQQRGAPPYRPAYQQQQQQLQQQLRQPAEAGKQARALPLLRQATGVAGSRNRATNEWRQLELTMIPPCIT